MLHIIKSQQALLEANHVISTHDVILLVEEAIYCANAHHINFSCLTRRKVYALIEDIAARGLTHRISPSVSTIDYVGFVDLTAQQTKSITWN